MKIKEIIKSATYGNLLFIVLTIISVCLILLSFIIPPTGVIDVSVTADGESITLKELPANADIASSGKDSIIVACTPEAMTSEIMALANLSRRALASVHAHELFLERSDDMLKMLNPRYAEERRREEKIASLENKIGGIEESIRGMRDMLSSALGSKENVQK